MIDVQANPQPIEATAFPISGKQQFLVCSLLVALTLLLYLPVLIHPHWGMFDDAALIVQAGRRLADHPESLSSMLDAGLRMSIYYLLAFLWLLFPENPRAFYACDFLFISGACVLTYLACFQLSRNVRISAISTGLFFLSAGFFEVIYTLDKQEVYLPLLFALVLTANIMSMVCRIRIVPIWAMVAALSSALACITKETGAILCVFSSMFLVANLVMFCTQRSPESKSRLVRSVSMWAAIILTFFILRFIVFRQPPADAEHYVSMTFHGHKLFRKLAQYAVAMPEFFLPLLLSVIGTAVLSFSRRFDKTSWQWCVNISLLSSTLIATGALVSFDSFASLLLYIWIPIYVFLLPTLAYTLTEVSRLYRPPAVLTNKVFPLLVVVFFLMLIPSRFVLAQFQFSMDAVFDDLAHTLSILVQRSSTPLLGAMPVFNIDSTEIPERMEAVVRDKLVQRYYDSRTEKTRDYRFAMLNYLSSDNEERVLKGSSPGVFLMPEFRGRQLTYTSECPKGHVGWCGFQILGGSTAFQIWVKRPLLVGDLIIIPFGDLKPNAILYRGGGIFSADWKAYVLSFPQLTFKELGGVNRKIATFGEHRRSIGWKILQVETTDPVSLESTSDGWLTGKRILYQYDASKPVLRIITGQPLPPLLNVAYSDGHEVAIPVAKEGDKTELFIPLHGRDKVTDFVEMRSPTGGMRIHIDSIRMVSNAPHLSAFELYREDDGWLGNDSFVLYPQSMQGKHLLIETKQECCKDISLIGQQRNTIAIQNSKASISLSDGNPTADGRFCIRLHSDKPLKFPQDKRQLLLHVDQYQIR